MKQDRYRLSTSNTTRQNDGEERLGEICHERYLTAASLSWHQEDQGIAIPKGLIEVIVRRWGCQKV